MSRLSIAEQFYELMTREDENLLCGEEGDPHKNRTKRAVVLARSLAFGENESEQTSAPSDGLLSWISPHRPLRLISEKYIRRVRELSGRYGAVNDADYRRRLAGFYTGGLCMITHRQFEPVVARLGTGLFTLRLGESVELSEREVTNDYNRDILIEGAMSGHLPLRGLARSMRSEHTIDVQNRHNIPAGDPVISWPEAPRNELFSLHAGADAFSFVVLSALNETTVALLPD